MAWHKPIVNGTHQERKENDRHLRAQLERDAIREQVSDRRLPSAPVCTWPACHCERECL